MYQLTCDGFPLLDWRDDDLILVNPKLNLEVNTVGSGSFTIYKNHPYYDKLQKLKSVFEVSDDTGVIFRGRATGDSRDFDHGMTVDLEGAMAFFNDSIVRPFSFPKDFEENAEYTTAAASGNVVAFFLSWLIDNHNAQVQDFQKMKLGNVTVTDPDNSITRSNSNYASTWDVLKSKLIDSALGGYLCIRYEADGNYIDYLSEFTETNSQRIEYGENLLDLKNETEASETYSAIIPIGAAGLTIEGLDDGDITDDLVKSGDTIYSRSAVAEYGWIYAPIDLTTWDDVVDDRDLRTVGAEWLANGGASLLKAIEATAVDLHFTDEQAESLRIYKNVEVHSKPHGVTETFPLNKLEIDLLHSQNTKITVGKTLASLTERTSIQQDEVLERYSKLSKTDEEIKMEVRDEIDKLSSSFTVSLDSIRSEINGKIDGKDAQTLIDQSLEAITLEVSSANGSTTFRLTADGAELSSKTLNLSVDAVNVTGKLTASQIDATNLHVDAANIDGDITIDLTGSIRWADLSAAVQNEINDAYSMAEDAEAAAADAVDTVDSWRYDGGTYIDSSMIMVTTLMATELLGGEVALLTSAERQAGGLDITGSSSSSYAIELWSNGALRLVADSGAVYIGAEDGYLTIEEVDNLGYQISCGTDVIPGGNLDFDLGDYYYRWNKVWADEYYAITSCTCDSDRNKKNSISYEIERYDTFFDKLQAAIYKLNAGTSGRYHVGMIAQDVEQALADCEIPTTDFAGIVKREDGYALRYDEFIGLLIWQVQKLKARMAEMEMKLA